MSVVALPLAFKKEFFQMTLFKNCTLDWENSVWPNNLIYNGNVVTAYLSLAGKG